MKKKILVLFLFSFFFLVKTKAHAFSIDIRIPQIENPIENISRTIESGLEKLEDTLNTRVVLNQLDLESGVNQATRQIITDIVTGVEQKTGLDKTNTNLRNTFNDAIRKIDNYLDLNLDEKSRSALLKLRTIYKNGVDDINRSESAKKTPAETADETAGEEKELPSYTTTGALGKSSKLGTLISKAIPYVYVAAGLGLLIVLIMGGITLMTAAGNPDKTKAGYGKIKAGLIGFLIIFVSYFAVQLVQVVLGVKIF